MKNLKDIYFRNCLETAMNYTYHTHYCGKIKQKCRNKVYVLFFPQYFTYRFKQMNMTGLHGIVHYLFYSM